jgi:PPK2 family polyphosphate:nucleotide phosphotransferase
MFDHYVCDGRKKFRIDKASTNDTSLIGSRKEAEEKLEKNNSEIDQLQARLYADKKEGVIFLFQAMDAAGKDGTIRAVLQCLSPHGVHEAAFKAPSSTELAHDFLWRIEQQVPAKGEIAIFNRSHYEDVLIGKVKKLYENQDYAERIDRSKIIDHRYEDIRNWEKYLWHNNIRVVKIFLNVSKDEQALRFLSRIEEPEKNWKFSESDWNERKYWDAYQQAFEDCINETATDYAPWYIVPADHKWYMRYVVSEIILATLNEMNPQYPEVTQERLEVFRKLKEEILSELPAEKLEAEKKKKDKKKKKAGKAA